MKAMVFAAGLGTRLRPITDRIPKALVTVQGKSILEILIEKLIHSGFNELIINVHHHAIQIIDFLKTKNNFGIPISISDESGLLLDTGGGLKKASWFFDDGKPFLIHNVDILSDIDLIKLYKSHLENPSLATLAVQNRKTDRLLLFDTDWDLIGWKNALSGTIKLPVKKEVSYEMAFCGIHVIDPALLKKMNQKGIFSIIDVYLDLVTQNRIRGYDVTKNYWTDIGNPGNLEEAEIYYRQNLK